MQLSGNSAQLLAALPAAVPRCSLLVVDERGEVQAAFGDGPRPELALAGGELRVEGAAAAGRVVLALGTSGWLVASFAEDLDRPAAGLLQQVLQAVAERESLERDMESMNSGALQLMEQVAMVGETLPHLSAGANDAEIVAMGLKALLLAAGVERAAYVRYHADSQQGEPLVWAVMAANGNALVDGFPGPALLRADAGILGAVLAAEDAAVLRLGGGDDDLGRLAQRQVLGAPVTYGSGDQRVVLGALLVMDKRRSAFATSDRLGSEEGQIVHCFAAMLGAVLGARKVAELGKELSMAQVIQHQILPPGPPSVAGFDLAARHQTCGEVGGDYYDYVPLADGGILAVVADVSGHNLASGMVMVGVRSALRTLATQIGRPAPLFERLASGAFDDLTRTERFLTAAGVLLHAGDTEVELVNAGHAEVLHYRAATRTVTPVAGGGTILGFLPAPDYEAARLRLAAGDVLLLYTDGIVECAGPDGTLFGEDRLSAVLAANGHRPADEIVGAVLVAVHAHRGQQMDDDMTALAVRALGPVEAAG